MMARASNPPIRQTPGCQQVLLVLKMVLVGLSPCLLTSPGGEEGGGDIQALVPGVARTLGAAPGLITANASEEAGCGSPV